MRLYLALAVLVLAFVAYTEAQEQTIEQKFNNLGEQLSEIRKDLTEKVKTAMETVQNSEIVQASKKWISDTFDRYITKTGDQSK